MCKLGEGSKILPHPWQEDTRALACSILRSILLAGVTWPTSVVLSDGRAIINIYLKSPK